MHNLDDILQLLEVSEETLGKILKAMSWEGLTQFDDDQSGVLLAVNEGHNANGWSYVESYLRKVADQQGLGPEEYDKLASAITQAGATLGEYRETFADVCQRFKGGASAEEAVLPPADKPVKLTEVYDLPPADGEDNPLAGLSPEELTFINEGGKTAATITLSRMQGFADKAAEEQERLEQAFLYCYRQEIAKSLRDPEFKAQFTLRLQRSMEGKKPPANEISGAATTIPLLSSTS
ncbi:hypothetical protein [Acaryochloris marina]|uniref:hypothetical protein n=1 Tax=Acaryochloris marina TaxID=155978 RepID=UPI0021C29581|nr:hypothetical protein [Acaryochloris marina]BDM82844.1 hypothetical protein AM10699_57050 [Acaryochloris marina MBIC10699]